MSLTNEQNVAWCRKCIDIIKGDETVKEPQIRKFAPMDQTEIEIGESGLWVRQDRQDGSGVEDCVFIPNYMVERFVDELTEVAGIGLR